MVTWWHENSDGDAILQVKCKIDNDKIAASSDLIYLTRCCEKLELRLGVKKRWIQRWKVRIVSVWSRRRWPPSTLRGSYQFLPH